MKFIVMYLAPSAGIEAWMAKPEAERAEAEAKMRAAWDEWMAGHSGIFVETNAVGKNTLVTKDGTSTVSNNLMLYSIVEGESPEAVAALFIEHPHFGIPDATIEIMPIRSM